MFYAPFFTTWFCSMGTLFIFPIYLIGMVLTGAKSSKIQASFKDGIQGFRNKGITIGETFLTLEKLQKLKKSIILLETTYVPEQFILDISAVREPGYLD